MFLSSITDCILLFVLWLTNIYPFNQCATAALQSSAKEPATNKHVDENIQKYIHLFFGSMALIDKKATVVDHHPWMIVFEVLRTMPFFISFEDQIYLLRTRIGSWSQKWGASPCELACLIGKQGDSGFSFGFSVFLFLFVFVFVHC